MLPAMAEPTRRGIFPLDLVLMPGEARALHIFEMRYRQLFADCTLEVEPFVLVREHEGVMADVGCEAEFEQLVQRSEDGRLAVIVRGLRPVEVVPVEADTLYRCAMCTPVADSSDPLDADLEARIVDLYRSISEVASGTPREPDVRPDVPLSYSVAGQVELPDDTLQALLDERDENHRRRALVEALIAAEDGVRAAKEAQNKASTNGKVPHT